MTHKLNREELAALEVGQTTITRPLALGMVISFLLLVFSVPCLQELFPDRNKEMPTLWSGLCELVQDGNTGFSSTHERSSGWTLWRGNNRLLERMDHFEHQLEEGSFLRSLLLAPGQRILLSLGYGNEKVYPGRRPWLFYRPDMDYLMGPGFLEKERLKQRRMEGKIWEKSVQPDPLVAILDFNRQLAERGITLILMPTPSKGSLCPQYFAGNNWSVPLQNRSWTTFIERLEFAAIPFFDPAPILANITDTPTYLQTDTHWQPQAMEVVAEQLALTIEQRVSLSEKPLHLQRKETILENQGDIDAMLLLPKRWKLYPEEQVAIHPVLTRAQELWQPVPTAEVLLLGDSFSNIYSLAGMGWGERSGLGEQLSYFLDRPVDVLLQNDAGAFASRELLAAEMARGRDRLAGKKVVIWEFASRELSSGDWKTIGLELRHVSESSFYVPAKGEKKKVQGILAAISRSPLPGSVPYKDNIITLHLTDIRDLNTGEQYGQALVYGWGMRDNTLTALAGFRVGEQVELELVDWEDVQNQYSSYRRSTLDDEMIELEIPLWGEPLP